MKTIIKDALILFAITAIAGLMLALVNEVTKDPIAEQQLKAKSDACKVVFEDASAFEEMGDDFYQGLNTFGWVNEHPKNAILDVYAAKDANGGVIGYVINISTSEGYGSEIDLCIGIRNDRTINGISVLSSQETVGLGLEADNVLSPQFAGRNAESFVYSKTGATADNEVDAISSATITTNAYVNCVNASLKYFDIIITKGGN